MKLLVLGGTQFVGRHIVETALARGHEVTLFNRGNNPSVFPNVEQLKGDRNDNLSALEGRTWDAAIDTCGYTLRQVKNSAELLADAVKHYTFISSISVYAHQNIAHQDENAELATLEDESVEEITGETYGGLKVVCERAAEAAMPNRVLHIRPGLIVGPFDHTDRFSYWPIRIAQGGEVLAPNNLEAPVQFIDVRDLATWTFDMIEANQVGAYNAVTKAGQFTMGQLLETCKTVSGSDAAFVLADENFLLEQEVSPWMGLPLWIPGDDANFMLINNEKAAQAGLSTRSLEKTVKDTLEWHQTRPADHELRAGIKPEKEQVVLKAWIAKSA